MVVGDSGAPRNLYLFVPDEGCRGRRIPAPARRRSSVFRDPWTRLPALRSAPPCQASRHSARSHEAFTNKIFSRHREGDFRIWCSHMRMTFQPARRSERKFLASLRMLPAIFLSQCSDSFNLHVGKRHPCQKSPSTKIAILRSRSTKSGRPGRSLQCSSHVRPAVAMSCATASSGFVPFPRIRDITALRVEGLMMSPRWRRTPVDSMSFFPVCLA
jgi:hypothetical protein